MTMLFVFKLKYFQLIGLIINASLTVINSWSCGDDESWLEYGGLCLKNYSKEVQWSSAKGTCSIFRQAQLVTVDSPEINTFVLNNLISGSNVWIGLSVPDISKPSWKWSDGENTLSYDDWKNTDFTSACAVMTHADNKGMWYTSPCTNMKNYICEKEITRKNCSEWHHFDTHCYLIIEESKTTNMAAARNCWQYDAYLISINSKTEADFIYNITEMNNEYWIGLSPLKWVNDVQYQWNNWDDSGPTHNITYGCVYIDATSGKWFCGHCGDAFLPYTLRPYICQKDAKNDTQAAPVYLQTSNIAKEIDTTRSTNPASGTMLSKTDTDNPQQLLLTVVVPAACGGLVVIIVIVVVCIVLRRKRRSNKPKKENPPQIKTTAVSGSGTVENPEHRLNDMTIHSQCQENYIYDEAEVVQAGNGTIVVNGDVYAIVDKDETPKAKVQDQMISPQHTGVPPDSNGKQEIANGHNHIIVGSDVYTIVNKSSVKPDRQHKPKQKKKKPPTPPKLEDNSGEINSNGLSHVVVGTDVYAVVDKDKVKPNKQQTTQQKKPPTPPKLEDKTEDLNTNGQSHIAVGTDVYAVVDKEKVKPNKQQKPQQRKKKPPAPPKLVEKADVMHEGSVYYESDINAIPATPTKHKTEVKKKTEDTGVVYADLDLTGSGSSNHQAGNHYEVSGVVYADVRG